MATRRRALRIIAPKRRLAASQRYVRNQNNCGSVRGRLEATASSNGSGRSARAGSGGDYKPGLILQPGSEAVVQGVASNKFAIGYSGIGGTVYPLVTPKPSITRVNRVIARFSSPLPKHPYRCSAPGACRDDHAEHNNDCLSQGSAIARKYDSLREKPWSMEKAIEWGDPEKCQVDQRPSPIIRTLNPCCRG